ncbi:MAG: rod shape-determining protein [Lachnospiraceae bacterium]|nr:rod shape-determining protein [Lachnospiraceae bacterium]
MGTNIFGIDLGTNNIKIYSQNDDGYVIEKNMIAIENKKNIFAYGDSAYEMYEKVPSNIRVSFPLNNGVIADIRDMEVLIRYFISDICKGKTLPADYYMAVPTDVTDVERRAFYDLVKNAGVKVKEVYVVEKAVADGLGLGIDVKTAIGALIVDIGFHTTEISLISLGGIVLSKLIKTGGLKFDETIKSTIRKEYNLVIGSKTSEKLKISLKELEESNQKAVVFGRDIVTGLPMERTVDLEVIDAALSEQYATIIDHVKLILERTPPELSADIYRNGLYLTGGASQIVHFGEQLAAGTGLKVIPAENPVTSVAAGLAKVINEDYYKTVAFAVEGMNK